MQSNKKKKIEDSLFCKLNNSSPVVTELRGTSQKGLLWEK